MKDNDYQLALNYLIENIEMLNRHSDGAFCLPYWSKKKLQELVDKSKPKMVKYDAEFAGGYLIYKIAFCPNCGYEFNEDDVNKINYCPKCGQHLDWSDDD